MKLKIFVGKGKEKGTKELPIQFNEVVRPDIIKRAVFAIESNMRQPYGASPEAGKRASADLSRRRRKYRGSYGFGISRVPRKILSRRGTRMNWAGAVAPGTVGGRRAHPPKAEKEWAQKLNKKEKRKAIRSAIAATIIPELVKKRNHKVPDEYPFILDSSLESLSKTKEVRTMLADLGFNEELARTKKSKIRAGKGTLRGRKYQKKVGPLIVVSEKCGLLQSARNIAGVDIVPVSKINCKLLAPGADPGRVTLFTDKAIDKLEKEQLFM